MQVGASTRPAEVAAAHCSPRPRGCAVRGCEGPMCDRSSFPPASAAKSGEGSGGSDSSRLCDSSDQVGARVQALWTATAPSTFPASFTSSSASSRSAYIAGGSFNLRLMHSCRTTSSTARLGSIRTRTVRPSLVVKLLVGTSPALTVEELPFAVGVADTEARVAVSSMEVPFVAMDPAG